MTRVPTTLICVLLLAVGLFLVGCASHGGRGAKASNGLIESAKLIDKGVDELDATVDSLSALTLMRGADLSSLFKTYSKDLKSLESTAARVGATHTKMQREGESYFEDWDEQIAKIQNEDLQAQSTERRNEVAAQLEDLSGQYDALADSYRELVANLRDIHLVLQTDLTMEGVSAISGLIEETIEQAGGVSTQANAIADIYRQLGVRMSASTR